MHDENGSGSEKVFQIIEATNIKAQRKKKSFRRIERILIKIEELSYEMGQGR